MSEMSVSMILKLVDQVTGPAKNVETELQKLKRATDVLNDIQKGPMKSPKWDEGLKAINQRRQEIEALQKTEQRAASAAQAIAQETVAAAEKVATSEQRAATAAQTAARETAAAKEGTATAAAGAAAQIVAANEKIVGSEKRAAAAFEVSAKEQASAAKALERQRSAALARMAKEEYEARQPREPHLSRHGLAGFVAGSAASAVSAHSVYEATKEAVEAGAERQHIETKALNAGIPAADVVRIQKAAIEAKRGAPNMSVSEIEELFVEARSAVKHPEETFEIINSLAKAGSVLRGMGVDNSGLALIVKAAESLGRMNSPEQFKAYLDGQIKAMQVFGKTITPEQIYEAAKYSKASGATLSDAFVNGTMPSLIQEMRGSSAGDALSMLGRTLRGGLEHRGTATQLLDDIDMLDDKNQIHHNNAGKITGYGGKIAGNDLLATNPDRWVWEVWKPHLEAAGHKTLQDQIEYTNRALPSTAANLVRILLQQEESIKQHQQNLAAAADAETAASNQAKEAAASFGALTKSLNDLASAATGPAMPAIAAGLNKITGAINFLSEKASENPRGAVAVGGMAAGGALYASGWLFYQAAKGFGLPAAAGELTVAARALEGAAGRMAGGAGLPKAPGEGPGGAGLTSRALMSIFPFAWAMWNMPTTPEEFKKQAKANDDLADGANDLAKKYLPAWLFPEKTIPERIGEWWRGPEKAQSSPSVTVDAPPPAWTARAGAANPVVNGQSLDEAKAKADETKTALDQLNVTLSPKIDLGPLDALISKVMEARKQLSLLGSMAPSGSFKPSHGALHDGPEGY